MIIPAKDKGLWEQLDVLPEDVEEQAQITPILIKSLGSIKRAIEYLRESDAKEAIAVLKKWDSSKPIMRKKIPLEAFCLSVNVKPKVLIGVIMQAVVEHGSKATELMIAAAQPEIVQKTIKLAKTYRGSDERRIILQNRGVLPSPKNQVFINNGSVDNRKQVANVSLGQLESDNDKIGEAVDNFNSQRMLKDKNDDHVPVIDVVAEEAE